jgi:hypothetical protein
MKKISSRPDTFLRADNDFGFDGRFNFESGGFVFPESKEILPDSRRGFERFIFNLQFFAVGLFFVRH